MDADVIRRLEVRAAEADGDARRAIEARDADYYRGRADAFREAAILLREAATRGS